MATGEKQYGLLDPKTSKKISASDVFGNDSDSGSDHGADWLKKPAQKEEKVMKRQTKIEMQRALQQDPTVYQYDEIYDEMQQKKEDLEASKAPVERKPKYIQALLKSADDRKKENERRLVRQIQMEREAEGDMFKDKEEFITSSYKQKLEEFKKAEEEERKMEYIESVMDVSKQQDLGGFYRNLYKETIGKENNSENAGEAEVKEPEKKAEEPKIERNYRKRSNSEGNDAEEKKSKHESSSSSSDSDSSSDSSSSSSTSEEEGKSENKENEAKPRESVRQAEDKAKKESEEGKKTEMKNDAKRQECRDEKRNASIRKQDERRDRSYRSSYNDRDRGSRGRRDDRGYRERERERDRERSRRDDRRGRDGRDRRRSTSRRRRRRRSTSRSSEGRRGRDKSRERRRERSRSRRRHRDPRNDVEKQKAIEVKDTTNPEVKPEEKKEQEQQKTEPKPSIWEKRTVGAVFEAALERYYQRKAARGY